MRLVTCRRLSVLLLFTVWAGCARKPSGRLKQGVDEGLYEKSKFENKTFVVGKANDEVGMFIDAALKKEQGTKANLQLLSSPESYLTEGKDVTFKVTGQNKLQMYFAKSTDPVAQWSLSGQCYLDRELTAKGERTRFVVPYCDNGRDPAVYTHFKANVSQVSVREIANGAERVVAKSTVVGKGGALTSETYTVKTGKFKNKGLAVTYARELVLDPSFKEFADLRPVEFRSTNVPLVSFNSDVLSDIEFLGKENQEYQVRFRLTENFLLVEKVVNNEGIGPQEKSYAQELGNGLYAVTIVGYPISKLKYDHLIDQGEKSVNLTSYSVNKLEEASHLMISEAGAQKFAAIEKLDVFSSDFFKNGDEWIFEKSLVDRPIDTLLTEAQDFYPGNQFNSGRVKVYKNKNSIQLLDVNIPEEAKNVDGEKLATMLEIPARWVDYRVKTTGSSANLAEEALEDGHAGANEWDKRRFALFEFNRADHLQDSRSDQFKLKRLEIAPDYLAFDVYESQTGLTIKYSMVRAKDKGLVGRVFPKKDHKVFGFWANEKSVYPGVLTDFQDVSDNNIVLHRAYPDKDPNNDNKPTIWIHLTKNMQNEPYLVDGVNEAVNAWDNTFKLAAVGTGKEPISVKLSPDMVEVGDVRFNKVVFWGWDISTRPSGYGPSVADQKTGQIVNATNHIYLRRYRELIWGDIRNYIRHNLGYFEDKGVKGLTVRQSVSPGAGSGAAVSSLRGLAATSQEAFTVSLADLREMGMESAQISSEPIFQSSIQERLAKVDIDNIDSIMEFKDSGKDLFSKEYLAKREFQQPFYMVNGKKTIQQIEAQTLAFPAAVYNTYEQIRTLCDSPESNTPEFRKYLNELRQMQKEGQNISHLVGQDEKAYQRCTELIMRKKIAATLVHEFGHNFGMTHNFAASTDKAHYPVDNQGKIISTSSSVMEYPHYDEDRSLVPGPYDIAAIRYAYYDAYTAKDAQSRTVILPWQGLAIVDDLEKKKNQLGTLTLDEYRFCNERDLEPGYGMQRPVANIYCRRWDKGATYSERVQASIDHLLDTFATSKSRFDGADIATEAGLANYLVNSDLINLKILYDHFRLLLNKKTELKDPYLAGYKTEKELEQAVMNTKDEEVIDGYKASRLSYKLLKELVYSPISYCVAVVKGPTPSYKAFPFELMRGQVFITTQNQLGQGVTVDNCQEATPYIVARPEFKDKKVDVVAVGNNFNRMEASADPLKINTGVKAIEVGIRELRRAAQLMLLGRVVSSGLAQSTNFKPSFLDEPQMRQELISSLLTRSLIGEAIGRWLPDNSEDTKTLPFYTDELGFYLENFSLILTSGNAPGSSINRLGVMRPVIEPGSVIEQRGGEAWLAAQGAAFITDAGGNYYWAKKERVFAYYTLNTIRDVQRLKTPGFLTNPLELKAKSASLVKAVRLIDDGLRALFKGEVPSDEKWEEALNATLGRMVQEKLITVPEANFIVDNLFSILVEQKYQLGVTEPGLSAGNEDLITVITAGFEKTMMTGFTNYSFYLANQRELDAQLELLNRYMLSQGQ